MKKLFWKLIEKLLLKSKAFRSWYKHRLENDLYDLELSEELLSRKEIYNKKLEQYNKISPSSHSTQRAAQKAYGAALYRRTGKY